MGKVITASQALCFLRKNRKTKSGKGNQHKTTRYYGTKSYCVLCKKSRYPERRYKYNSSEKGNAFNSAKTKKYLDGSLTNLDDDVKHFHNTEKNIQNKMKALKNLSDFSLITKKTSPHCELNKMKSIKK